MDEQIVYQNKLKLSDEIFHSLKESVSALFENQFDIDSRFFELSDARKFVSNYLLNLTNIKIISIALEEIFMGKFCEEIENSPNKIFWAKEKQACGQLLGYDILGFDIMGFHTYLCNSLDKDISKNFMIKTNEVGLIQNPYFQVKEFSKFIAEMGEPVLWLPFAIYEHCIV